MLAYILGTSPVYIKGAYKLMVMSLANIYESMIKNIYNILHRLTHIKIGIYISEVLVDF